uniref:Transposase (Putative), gypsy type n=1 Tax=Tanacetum cinerariifolium TaxID=118510 RepID=A0A699GUW8_TANCI|nr:hypothetical protein [Tanacetum cinerariifolium]
MGGRRNRRPERWIDYDEEQGHWGIARPRFRYLSVVLSSFAVTYASATFPCIGSITDIKSVLTQRALNVFCETFHIPDEVHPQLPSPNQTIHEMPTGKIGVYTRFFEYSNFRLFLSTFLVNVLKHYHVHISRLSVIGAAKVSHFEILCRVYGFEPTVGLFCCFYVNSKNKGWMSFSKRQGTDAVCYTKPLDSLKGWNDHFSGSMLLLALPYFRSILYPEPFLCLVGMSHNYTLDENTYPQFLHNDDEEIDLMSLIRTADPTKVRIDERQRDEVEPKLLETTVGRIVPLLSVAPDRSSGELEASVDKLFDEGGSDEQAKQGDSASGGHGVGIDVVAETIVEDVAPAQLKHQKKRKTKVANAGEPSHPAKKLRGDYEAPGGPTVYSKSQSSIQRLFARAVQNAKHEDGDYTEFLAGANLRAIGAPQRFVISSDSSDHSSVNIAEAEVDSVVRTSMPIITSVTTTPTTDPAAIAKEKLVGSSVFGADSLSAGGSHPISCGFSDCSGSDFLVGGIRTMIDPDSNLQKVYLPQWNVTNGSCLVARCAEVRMRVEYHIKEKRRSKAVVEEKNQVLKATNEEIENLKAQLLLKEAEAAKAIRLRAETSKLEVAEKSIRDEDTALNERNIILEKECNALDVKVMDLQAVVVSKDRELTDSTAQLTSIKSHNDNLVDHVYELQVSFFELKEKLSNYENLTERLEEFQDAQLKVVNDKFDKLYADFVEVTLCLEERFYPYLLTTIAGRIWLLTHLMELAIVKCLNSPEYLSAPGIAVSKAIEKGMQDGLAAGIIHGRKGRVLTDVAAHNPAAEADYVSALQQLQSVNFSLLAELKANKDASIEAVMNILRLEEHLAVRLGLNESQPHANQLMVPIHHSLDKTVVGIEVTSGAAPATADLTTALSVTLASVGSVTLLSIDDYRVMGADDQSAVNESVVDEDVNPFLNVDDAELNIPY